MKPMHRAGFELAVLVCGLSKVVYDLTTRPASLGMKDFGVGPYHKQQIPFGGSDALDPHGIADTACCL
jgi:hypothetical protein